MTAQLYDSPGVNYDVRKLTWLARVSSEAKVALLGPKSPYRTVLDLAKSAMLRRALDMTTSLPFASPSAMVFPTSVLPSADAMLAIAQDHHRSILEAIGQRQGARAESLAREHALLARRVLDIALSDHNALSRVPGGPLINIAAR